MKITNQLIQLEKIGLNTIKQFNDYLDTPEYEVFNLSFDSYYYNEQSNEFKQDYSYHQRNNSIPTLQVYDDFLEAGIIPTPKDYIEAVAGICKEYYKTKGVLYTKGIDYSVRQRALNTYISTKAELKTQLLIYNMFIENNPANEMFVDNNLDFIMGVDMVLKEGNKLRYIHIMSKSPNSINYYNLKESRNYFSSYGIPTGGYQRNFKKHTKLSYGKSFNEDRHSLLDYLDCINEANIEFLFENDDEMNRYDLVDNEANHLNVFNKVLVKYGIVEKSFSYLGLSNILM